MAQTKRKRRRKHRGTQTGRIDSRPRGKPKNRAEAKQRAASRSKRSGGGRQQRALAPPTWSGALMKGLVAGLIFFALIAIVFKRPIGASAGLAGFMLLFYVPMSYYTDGFFYRRRLREAQKQRMEKAQQRGGSGNGDS